MGNSQTTLSLIHVKMSIKHYYQDISPIKPKHDK